MVGKVSIIVLTAVCMLMLDELGQCNPLIGDLSGNLDYLGICVHNCAQCKKMYGAYFEGQVCADTCIKFKGKTIPDCKDVDSIVPYLTNHKF